MTPSQKVHHTARLCLLCLLCLSSPLYGMEDLTEISIEELANIKVTSVSRKPQRLSHAPTAIFVITGDEIRRSGSTSIPEALRMVPGLQVARISSNKWAISSRGFNSRYANKLLVQMDGRTLYSPLFSGVFWELHDTLMADIDRIEVIRGPGASLWGANAVNGIINIITRAPKKTQGALATQSIGTWHRRNGGVRYGAPAGDMGHYRLYATYDNWDEAMDSQGDGRDDVWDTTQGGFRTDLSPNTDTRLTVQGDTYTGHIHEKTALPSLIAPYTTPYENENTIFGMNLLSRISHHLSATSEVTLQCYYDRSEKEEAQLSWQGDLVDLDFQHRFQPLDDHEVIWGTGYRYYADTLSMTENFTHESPETSNQLLSAFLQDEITLTPSLQLTLGTKIEHNDYTHVEIQPNARLLWAPNAIHSAWWALSRAVRTPNRSETQLRIQTAVLPPGTPENQTDLPVEILTQGNAHLDSETLTALEMGYRLTPEDSFSLDLTLFYYFYKDLMGYTPSPPRFDPEERPLRITQVHTLENAREGQSWGVEIVSNWKPMPLWRLQLSETLFQGHFSNKSEFAESISEDSDNAAPAHQLSLRSGLDLPRNLTLDLWIRHVAAIQEGRVPAYTELDTRIAWSPMKGLELSITGQNLLHKRHPEFIETLLWVHPTEVERSIHAQATLSF